MDLLVTDSIDGSFVPRPFVDDPEHPHRRKSDQQLAHARRVHGVMLRGAAEEIRSTGPGLAV